MPGKKEKEECAKLQVEWKQESFHWKWKRQTEKTFSQKWMNVFSLSIMHKNDWIDVLLMIVVALSLSLSYISCFIALFAWIFFILHIFWFVIAHHTIYTTRHLNIIAIPHCKNFESFEVMLDGLLNNSTHNFFDRIFSQKQSWMRRKEDDMFCDRSMVMLFFSYRWLYFFRVWKLWQIQI